MTKAPIDVVMEFVGGLFLRLFCPQNYSEKPRFFPNLSKLKAPEHREKLQAAYEVLKSKKESIDTFFWQVASILLLGEPILFQISLTADDRFGVIIPSVLGILFSLVVHYSFWRNRKAGKACAVMMGLLEETLDYPNLHRGKYYNSDYFGLEVTKRKKSRTLPARNLEHKSESLHEVFSVAKILTELYQIDNPNLWHLHHIKISTAWNAFFLLVDALHIVVLIYRVVTLHH